jgi:hypothetical protein
MLNRNGQLTTQYAEISSIFMLHLKKINVGYLFIIPEWFENSNRLHPIKQVPIVTKPWDDEIESVYPLCPSDVIEQVNIQHACKPCHLIDKNWHRALYPNPDDICMCFNQCGERKTCKVHTDEMRRHTPFHCTSAQKRGRTSAGTVECPKANHTIVYDYHTSSNREYIVYEQKHGFKPESALVENAFHVFDD